MSAVAKLNVQGLARKEELLMGCLLADPGHTLVSVDLSAGEPTATCHYSGDRNYYDACFGMVGHEPYFDRTGVLKIDDIYLTGASFSPMGKDTIREVFSTTYGGKTAFEVWRTNPNKIKAELEGVRALHKILVLGIGYSMGPRKMVKQCYDKGYDLSYADAKAFFKAYWQWCPRVRDFARYLERQLKDRGYLVNDFGFRLQPDQEYKAFNYYIQSTVSGIMNALIAKFFTACPEADLVTIIHDELLISVPDKLLGKAKLGMQAATDSLNEDLNWSVKVRTGWVEGKTWMEAK